MISRFGFEGWIKVLIASVPGLCTRFHFYIIYKIDKIPADLIEVFKILNGIDNCDENRLFYTQPVQRTRGHSQKLIKRHYVRVHKSV